MNKFNEIKKWSYLLVACFLGSCNTNKATLNMNGSSLKYSSFLNMKKCLSFNKSLIQGGYLKKFYSNKIHKSKWKNLYRSKGQNYYNKRKTFDRKKASYGISIKTLSYISPFLVGASVIVKNQDEDNNNDNYSESNLTQLFDTELREKLDFAVMILQDPKLALKLVNQFRKSDFENFPTDKYGNNILFYLVKKVEFNKVSKKIINNCLPNDRNITNNHDLNLLMVSWGAGNYEIYGELIKKGCDTDDDYLLNLHLFFKKYPPEVELSKLRKMREMEELIESGFENCR